MNKLSQLLSLIFITLLCFTGCKKGENDPFLSLKTRKGRLTGDWTVEKYNQVNVLESSGYREVSSMQHGDYTIDLYYELMGQSDGIAGTVNAHTFQFEPDGTFRREFSYSYSVRPNQNSPEITYTINLTELGTWQFLGPTKDQKNKEYIAIELTKLDYNAIDSRNGISTTLQEETHVYNGEYTIRKYKIDRLANKEITLTAESTTSITAGSAFSDFVVENYEDSETFSLTR